MRPLLKIILFLLAFVFILLFVHELGHFLVAEYYGLNPKMVFFPTEINNDRPFTNWFAAYVSYDLPVGSELGQRVTFAGMWSEIFIVMLFYFILLFKLPQSLGYEYHLVAWFLFGILFTWLLIYNPLFQIPSSDMWNLMH